MALKIYDHKLTITTLLLIINIEHLNPSMSVLRPTLTPNRPLNFPFPMHSLKRSHCYFPSSESSFSSERKIDYFGKRNGQTSTECNTRNSISTVAQIMIQKSDNLDEIKDFVLQNLESLPQIQLPKQPIDFNSSQKKFCSSLKAIRKPKFQHELFLDPDSQKNLHIKDSYYNIREPIHREEIITTAKSIQAYPLSPGNRFSFHSFFPQIVVDTYQRAENKGSVHFIHGYLSIIDCLYFVVEKHLFLHFPTGSGSSFRNNESTIEMKVPNIIYSITETTVCLDRKEETNVIVMSHQFQIELYKINEDRKNPLMKLDIKYSTPNWTSPIIFTEKNGQLFYLPDHETINIASLDLKTGEVSNIKCIQIPKKQDQKCSIHKSIRKAWEAKSELTWKQIHEKLNSKLANSLLYDTDNWALKIGCRHCLQAKNLKMVSCCSSSRMFIICLMEIKYVGLLGKYLNKQNSSLERNAKVKKLVRIYWKQKGETFMNFQNIEFDDTKIDILDIRTSQALPKESFQIILLNKQTQKINQKHYTIEQQANKSHFQPKFICMKSQNFMKNVNHNVQIIGYENKRSLFNEGVVVLAKGQKRILTINNNIWELGQTFKQMGGGDYVGVKRSNALDSSLIITLGSDEGYVRVIEFTFLQWVFSAIQLELLSSPELFNLETFAEKLLINSIYISNKNSQNQCNSLLNLSPQQATKSLIELMTNLIILTNFRQDKQKNQTLKFVALIKDVVTIKYLPISHHVNDMSISLITHYSLNFKSILANNGMKCNFKLCPQKNGDIIKCSLNQIKDFIHRSADKRQSKSFSPIHKLTHSHDPDEQEVILEKQEEKDQKSPIVPYILSAETTDPQKVIDVPTQTLSKDQENQMSLKSQVLYSSPKASRHRDGDFNKTIKSTYKTNKQLQNKEINDKVITMQQRLFPPQQNKGIYQKEKNKNNGEVASAINRFCIANALVRIMDSVWKQPIGQISISTVQSIIDEINSIKSLGQEIGEYFIPKENEHSFISSPIISAFEEQNLSKIHYQSLQPSENKLVYSLLCETLELTKMIGHLCPNAIFRQTFTQHPWKFAQFLFIEFVKDYDSMLLDAWDSHMHRFLNCKLEIEPNPHLKSLTLKFWLQLYVQISPFQNRTKITKMIQNSVSKNEIFISQPKIASSMEQLKLNPQKMKQTYIVIPQFFLNYLETGKGVTQSDLGYRFID